MSHTKSREVILALKVTDELIQRLDAMRDAWRRDPQSVPKGLSCSESKEGHFALLVAESSFTTIPGACVIKGIGAAELVGTEPLFEPGANSKTLLLRNAGEGWTFAVKYVPPIVRERHGK